MKYVLIIHQVADFAHWKSVFNQSASIRKNAGEQVYQVLHDATDNNKVIHFSKWTSLEQARLFFESDELKRIRNEAGVEAPLFMYLNLEDSGVL